MSDSKQIYDVALQYLARREHSRVELKRKLLTKFNNVEAIDEVVTVLLQKNYLSDQRYTASMIRHRASQGYGWNYIRQELKQQGVAQEDMVLALEEIEIDWMEVAKNLYNRKFRKPIKDFKEKAKRMRYLYAHGFDKDVIENVINSES